MKVNTVKGQIQSDDLGITLSHEHILFSYNFFFYESPLNSLKKYAYKNVEMEDIHVLKVNPYISQDNLNLSDIDDAIKEVNFFKRAGGSTLVSVTPPGLGRDVKGLRAISEVTSVNIIASTGWYFAQSHPYYVKKLTYEDLGNIMLKEITEGIDGTDIKAGNIKCAVSEPLHPDEKKILKALSIAQSATGVSITLHPAVQYRKALDYIDILQKENVDLTNFYMSHMDLVYPTHDMNYIKSVLDTGVTINFDTFGFEMYIGDAFPGCDVITDKERIQTLVKLCELGYDKQIMVSQDNHMKIHMRSYGGYGYGHILEHIIPQLRQRDVSKKQIENILINNPKRLFSF